jgi:hypothetical protein
MAQGGCCSGRCSGKCDGVNALGRIASGKAMLAIAVVGATTMTMMMEATVSAQARACADAVPARAGA